MLLEKDEDPFAGADGKPWQYVSLRTDITESKLAAKALFTLKKSCEMQPSQVLKMVEKLLGSH
jgi:hypothetical protein